MPSLDENKALWDKSYDWSRAGEEWSREWGSSYMQWHGTLLPRMRAFLPAASVLEIAPGHGRWTRFLKDFCSRLSIVDLSATCIEACRRRFAGASNISYFVNDGRSLDMVPDGSVDFIFSFDSLVHA
jgi:ubiquinone/menaquinone biosynthesis C-methylase UbiE